MGDNLIFFLPVAAGNDPHSGKGLQEFGHIAALRQPERVGRKSIVL